MTLFPILDALDPNGYIMYRLVRDATRFVDGHHVKDLGALNRDLSKVIVIDWNDKSVKLHPENAFKLPRWTGNDDDTTLYDIAAFLKSFFGFLIPSAVTPETGPAAHGSAMEWVTHTSANRIYVAHVYPSDGHQLVKEYRFVRVAWNSQKVLH